MNRNWKLAGILALLAWAAQPAAAQDPKIDPGQRYLALATSATLTMQVELDKAAAQGFQIKLATSRGNSELILLLERGPRSVAVQYKLLAATDTITFQKEISDAGGEGWRAVRGTFLVKPHVMSVTEMVVIVEKSANSSRRWEYRLLATTLTSTLEKEWAEASGNGYAAVGILTRSEVMILMEKEAR